MTEERDQGWCRKGGEDGQEAELARWLHVVEQRGEDAVTGSDLDNLQVRQA